ncbi:MAG: sodium-dependent transporter, partial [Gemmatimonadota bacterium]
GNEGVTFIWIPKLFATLPGGRILMSFFFLALFFAAFTSLISMVELGTRVFLDMGWKRTKAVWLVGLTGLVMGLPSALSLDILHNQDWVWGIGLMMSGFLFAYAVIRYGVTRFREEQLNHEHSDIRIGAWWDILVKYLLPFQAIALMLWWMWQVRGPGSMNPFGVENIGTILFQWGIAIILLPVFNKKLGEIRPVAEGDLEANRMPPSIP